MQKLKLKLTPVLLMLLMCVTLLAACTDSDFITTSYKTLTTAAAVYDGAMQTAGDLYRQGMITDAEKQQLIAIGDKYRAAHISASSALEAFATYKHADDQVKVEAAVAAVAKLAGELSATLQPFLIRSD